MEMDKSQIKNAKTFRKLHVKGDPLLIYNAWDAGSAKSIAEAGARAIGTSSWAVAAAQGYEDGEMIPIDFVQRIAEQIALSVDIPVTVDFEGGYSDNDYRLARNITELIDLGVVGINFEDQIVNGKALYPIERQAERIRAVRKSADLAGVDFFINARTDVFFKGGESKKTVADALARAEAYLKAGASGLFVPGLSKEKFIKEICDGTDLPVNIMMADGVPSVARLAKLGASRISYGNMPFVSSMERLQMVAAKELRSNFKNKKRKLSA